MGGFLELGEKGRERGRPVGVSWGEDLGVLAL